MEEHRKRIRIIFTTPVLGTMPANQEIAEEFVKSKAPTPELIEEEIEQLTGDELVQKGMTIFARYEGKPSLIDYQIKGFFKDSIAALKRNKDPLAEKCKAYKKEVDGSIFVFPRYIPIQFEGEIGTCQRPLRAQTMQGERVSLANSEEIPAGSSIEIEILYFRPDQWPLIEACLNYGKYRGIGQWRNSGKGRFLWTEC